MNTKILGLLALAIAAGPISANAQTTILDYQGYVMGGTSQTVSSDFPGGSYVPYVQPPVSTTAAFNAQLVMDGTSVVSFDVNLVGNNGSNFSYSGLGLYELGWIVTQTGSGTCYSGSFSNDGCVNLTTTNGAVTGANIKFVEGPAKGPQSDFTIGANGDAFNFYGIPSAFSCADTADKYAGSNLGAPCTMHVSNPTAGVWKVQSFNAPEIDANGMAGGLTLLLGGLAVIRGRRRVAAR
jgi:hypothetical protein